MVWTSNLAHIIFRTFPMSNLKISSKSVDLVTLWTFKKLSSVKQKKVVESFLEGSENKDSWKIDALGSYIWEKFRFAFYPRCLERPTTPRSCNALTFMVIQSLNPFLLKQTWATGFFFKKFRQNYYLLWATYMQKRLFFSENFTSEPSK